MCLKGEGNFVNSPFSRTRGTSTIHSGFHFSRSFLNVLMLEYTTLAPRVATQSSKVLSVMCHTGRRERNVSFGSGSV